MTLCAGCVMEGRAGMVHDRTEQWLAAEVAGRAVLDAADTWERALAALTGEGSCELRPFAAASSALAACVERWRAARAALDAPLPRVVGDVCPACGLPR